MIKLEEFGFGGDYDKNKYPELYGFPKDKLEDLLNMLDQASANVDITEYSVKPHARFDGWSVRFKGRRKNSDMGILSQVPIPKRATEDRQLWHILMTDLESSYAKGVELDDPTVTK